MEPGGSIQQSKVPQTCPYPTHLTPVQTPTSRFLKIHLTGTCPIQGPNTPRTKSHVPFLLISLHQSIIPGPGFTLWLLFHKMIYFYREELLVPRPTTNLEDHPLSVVRYCLFNVFAASRGGSSIRNLKAPHAVVTGTDLSRGYRRHEAEKRIGTVFKGQAVQGELFDFWRWDRQYLPKGR